MLIRKRNDERIIYDDIRFKGEKTFSISDDFSYNSQNGYANYLNGMIHILKKNGHAVNTGFEVLIFSKLPAGGGISSSSALEIGFGAALTEVFGLSVSPIELAQMGQQSEHEFMNVQCGIMDQFSIAMGKKDYAMMLNTESLEYRYVPLELGEYCFIVMDSRKQRSLAGSKYNERRNECMEALRLIQQEKNVPYLCSLTAEDLPLAAAAVQNDRLFKRVRHCITEQERVVQAVEALQEGNLSAFGTLLAASHLSLQNDYEVTGSELDSLAGAANEHDACLGARMTGAGFGGCAIALVHHQAYKSFIDYVGKQYTKHTGLIPSFFACKAGNGTQRI